MLDFGNGQALIFAGIVATLVASAIAILKGAPTKIGVFLKSYFSISIEIRDPEILAALNEWLAAQAYGQRCRRLAVEYESSVRVGSCRRATCKST